MTTASDLHLRIEAVNASPVNDYRIRDGHVEVRLLHASGRPYAGMSGRWRVLDANDIQLHHNLRTVVSKWLRVRGGTKTVPLDKAA